MLRGVELCCVVQHRAMFIALCRVALRYLVFPRLELYRTVLCCSVPFYDVRRSVLIKSRNLKLRQLEKTTKSGSIIGTCIPWCDVQCFFW